MGTPVAFAHLNELFQHPEGGPVQYEGTSGKADIAPQNDPSRSPAREEDVDRVHEGSQRVR